MIVFIGGKLTTIFGSPTVIDGIPSEGSHQIPHWRETRLSRLINAALPFGRQGRLVRERDQGFESISLQR
jgi:hypothetical protein